MRVLFVSHHGALGGAERSLLELLDGLRERGVDPLLACPAPGSLAAAATRRGVPVFPLALSPLRRHATWVARGRFALRWMATTLRLIRIIVVQRVELVHTNSTPAQLWAWPALRMTRRAFVWHWRDFYDSPRLHRWLSGGRGASIAVSRSVRDFARVQIGHRGPVHLVPNGVSASSPPPRPESVAAWRAERGFAPADFLAVAMGQAIPRKGFSVLIRALALARARCTRLKVFLACPLPDEESRLHLRELRALVAEVGCEGAVVIAREIEEPGAALCAAEVVVVPSLREPFGRVPVEAMLAGKPVVCSAVDSLAEIVVDGATGVLVPAGEPGPLAEALVALAASPETCAKMGLRGRQRAMEEFPAHRTTEAILGVYGQLIGHRSPRVPSGARASR